MAQIEMREIHLPDYKVMEIDSKFAVHLQPSTSYAELSEAKKRLIQTMWDSEQERKERKMHEGAILSAVSFDQQALTGNFVPYKYLLAQIFDPSLKSDLKIVPVSLSGITYIQEGLIVAKRALWVTQFPGCYELAPSGGIRLPGKDFTQVDIKAQILDELQEETGIESSSIQSVKYFALIHDLKEDAVELCAEIHLKSEGVILSTSREYTQVMTIATSEIKAFAREYMAEFVPLSLMLLKLRGLID